jgi:multiple sugar transport system permease protein
MVLTKPEELQYGWFINTGMHGAYVSQNLFYQAGGDIVVQDADGKWEAVYNNYAGVEALKFYQKMLRGRWTRKGKEYRGVTTTLWDASSKIAMYFSTLNENYFFDPNTNPDITGIAPQAVGPKGLGGAEFNQTMLGINAAVKDKRVRDAAWEYIKFMASDEASRILVKTCVDAGQGKVLNPKLLKKFGYEEILKDVSKGWVEVHEKAMSYIHPEPYGKNCDMIYYELVAPLDNALLYDDVDYQAVLDEAVAHTNERLIGEIPPDVMKKRRQIVGMALIVLAGILVFFFIKFVKLMTQDVNLSVPTGGKKKASAKNSQSIAWLFMLPALLTVLVWQYYPLLRGMVMAFQDYKIMGGSAFVGIDNFVTAFWNPIFWLALKNTFIYVFLTITMGFFLPVILALMLNEIPRGTLFYRTLYYLPAITSGLVIMLLWKQFYDPSPAGLLNRITVLFGLPAQTWLQNPKLAMICVIIPGIWGGVGAGSIIYLAALKNIPEELYEASALDGASYFDKVWHVTLPTIRVLLLINFVGVFIGSFRATENILMMTGGGPLNATHVIGLEIFYNAFMYLQFGYATAMAWVLGALLIGFTVYQLKILRDVRFTTAK